MICDECHIIKSNSAIASKIINLLSREALLLVLATPFANHVRDIRGYLRIVWNPAWPFQYSAQTNSPADFYKPTIWGRIKERQTTESGISAEIVGLVEGGDNGENNQVNAPLHHAISPEKAVEEYRQYLGRGKGPLYIANLDLFGAYAA